MSFSALVYFVLLQFGLLVALPLAFWHLARQLRLGIFNDHNDRAQQPAVAPASRRPRRR